MKSPQEVEDALNEVDEHGPSKYPGMTYEQGVIEALQWVLGELADNETGFLS